MNPFDAGISTFLNSFVQRSWVLDTTMVFLSETALVKGGVMVALLWWAWFHGREERPVDRELVVATIAAALVGLFLARALAYVLPFRARPIHNPALHLRLAYGMRPEHLLGWSSFPSDHAVLFFAMATGILFVSRAAGVLALCFAFFMVCVPRLYLGIHYPTDIIAGALLGVGITRVGCTPRIRKRIACPVLKWHHASPGLFYAGFFLVTYQIAVLFDDVREAGLFTYHTLSAVLGGF